jgi:surface protein
MSSIAIEHNIYTLECRDENGRIVFLTQQDYDLREYTHIKAIGTFLITERTQFKKIREILGEVVCIGNMSSKFYGCDSFNCDINHWDVSRVTNMSNMFCGCTSFNSEIGMWDVSHVTNMESMFDQAILFNSSIVYWNVSRITNIENMFNGAISFNGDISPWRVFNVV